jgi:hypothetical protein
LRIKHESTIYLLQRFLFEERHTGGKMHHSYLKINLQEWFDGDKERTPRGAIVEFVRHLSNRSFSSFEMVLSNLLRDFCSFEADQSVFREDPAVKSAAAKSKRRLFRTSMREVYVSCLKKDELVLFVDIDPILSNEISSFSLELDILSKSLQAGQSNAEQLVDEVMKCFGLTGAKDSLLSGNQNTPALPFKAFRDTLTTSKPLNEALFQRIKELTDREILRELKKRGSVLESDLGELQISNTKPDRIKNILDYFSGEEHQLVNKKFAIVCRKKKEIIFLLKNRQDLENAKDLVCPKCSVSIGDESVLSYYESNDQLKELIDGSRWMPLLIRDELINAGVRKDDVYTEVKNGQDEIDLLAFYKGRILVIEAKDRPISLNDAYKLSAKTSRLEKVLSKLPASADADEAYVRTIASGRRLEGFEELYFIPIMISNYDIAQDARDLLRDTKEYALFLDNAWEKMGKFIESFISRLNLEDLKQRTNELISIESGDSISNLAAYQVHHAFQQMLKGD